MGELPIELQACVPAAQSPAATHRGGGGSEGSIYRVLVASCG